MERQVSVVGTQYAELRAELAGLKMSALRRRAVADGVASERVDEAADGDDERGSLIQAIVDCATGSSQLTDLLESSSSADSLRASLEGLRPRALKQRALAAGVDEHIVDAAFDEDNIKGSLVALIMAQSLETASTVVEQEIALQVELSLMKPRALCARAKELGIGEATAEEAFDADDVKGALIAIILEHTRVHGRVANAQHDVERQEEEARLEALRAELTKLRPRALRTRASQMGVDSDAVDDALDEDDVKGSLVALIVAHVRDSAGGGDTAARAEAARQDGLRAELTPLKLRALKTRGQASGVDEEHLDAALDADDPRAAMIELIIAQAASRRRDSAKISRPHHGGVTGSSLATKVAPPKAAAAAQPAPAPVGRQHKHVMLSYNWDHQSKVKRVYDMLTALGLTVWMDVAGGMSGDIYESMAAGVSNASVVVCFICHKYQESTNCMLEVRSCHARLLLHAHL
jgi:hypothetical protein